MTLVITPTYTWADGDLVTATRLNSTPTIADGQAGVFSSISGTSIAVAGVGSFALAANPATNNGGASNTLFVYTSINQAANVGGAIALGSMSVNATGPYAAAQIAGRKTNSTNGNYLGYLEFATNDAGGVMSRVGAWDLTSLAITGGLSATTGLNSTAVGNATPSTGVFTTLSSTGGTLNGSIGATTPSTGAFTTLSASGVMSYGGGITYNSADFTASATVTLADIPGLTFNVVSSGVYLVRFGLSCTQTGSGGYSVALGGSATQTLFRGGFTAIAATTFANSKGGLVTTGGSASAAIVSSEGCYFEVQGVLTVNAGGTLTVQFAQNSATATSTARSSSFFTLFRIA